MYNDLLKLFFEKNYDNTNDLITDLNELFKDIFPSLNIGKITIKTKRKVNIYSNKLFDTELVLFNNNDYDENNNLVFERETKSLGKYSIEISMKKSHVITYEEKIAIKRLSYLFSILFELSNYSQLLDDVNKLDPLTGYYNPIGINDYVYKLNNEKELDKFNTLYVNIKNCKLINRISGGIQNGDILIRQFADIIYDALEEDEIMGRYGEDNFTILIKKENTKKILELLKSITVSANINGTTISTNIEVVIGYYENNLNDSFYTLIDSSSTAMNIAKTLNNVNVVKFDEKLKEKVELSRLIQKNFYTDLNNEKIVPYYQPKVDINNNTICSAEALSRWFTNTGEILTPNKFIPVLEQYGYVCELDFYILNKVCKDIKEQLEKGLEPVTVSINFSRYHFIDQKEDFSFIERIINTIFSYGIDTEYIEIEFTEAGMLEDYTIINKFVEILHLYGIKVSIDDYGKGYSSLELLSQVPFDIIKMDKSFIDEYNTENGRIILTSTIDMMRKLGKTVICEGIENKDQINYLKNINCNIVQGYYYDKPLPKEDYDKRLVYKKYNK